MLKNTFKKEERLTSKKSFELLFNKGKSFALPPYRFVWIKAEASDPVKLGISVPKKSFAKSVERNRIKRRIREAYRKNKHSLYELLKKKNLSIDLMILYTAKTELEYKEIEGKMIVSLLKLSEQIQ